MLKIDFDTIFPHTLQVSVSIRIKRTKKTSKKT